MVKLAMWKISLPIFILLEGVSLIGGQCPELKGNVHRLGESRFYIHHYPKNRKDNMDWATAKTICSKDNFRLAVIEKLTTFTYVARLLENWVDKHKVLDTWYWIDSTFDQVQEAYTLGGNPQKILKYTNYFYRYPRPTGIGSQVNWRNEYEINSNVSQCLALALPLPGLATTAGNPGAMIFGHSATFDERPCTSSKKRHAICEYIPGCGTAPKDPFTITEDQDSYFDDGNWIVGNRRYIVSWKQRSQQESSNYCKSLGLKLLDPTLKEQCLIANLKLWSRSVTVSQFWTDWTYKVVKGNEGKFYDPNGKEVAMWRAFSNTSGLPEYQELIGRSNKFNKTFCVTLQLSYEYKNTQIPCPEGELSACSWNFIQYVPSNCNNFQGTVCQHTDDISRRCDWNRDWIKNPNEFLKDSDQATVEFGYKDNVDAVRSRYKQTFGSLLCPKGYLMARHDSVRWHQKSKENTSAPYLYDFLETYWVVDEDGFKKDLDSQCTISEPNGNGYKRNVRKVPCTEWHFYICEKSFNPTKPSTVKLPYTIPQATGWNEERHARIYPIL